LETTRHRGRCRKGRRPVCEKARYTANVEMQINSKTEETFFEKLKFAHK